MLLFTPVLLGAFASVVSAGNSLEGAVWPVSALGPQCPQVSIQQAAELASSCPYGTWKTWGRGLTAGLTYQVASRNLHGGAARHHCPPHAGTGSPSCAGVRACAWDPTCGVAPLVCGQRCLWWGRADENLHFELINKKLTITSVVLSSTS